MPSLQPRATHSHCPLPEHPGKAARELPQSMWNQLAPSNQKQLAQHLAELIRRIRRMSLAPQGNDDEQR